MGLNPKAVVFWIFTTSVGYLLNPTIIGAVAGLAVGLGISMIASVL